MLAGTLALRAGVSRILSLNPIAAPAASPPGVEEHFATLDGQRMRYLRAGTGPPLLLIHGLIGYSFSWRFNMAALEPQEIGRASCRERV